MNKCQMPNAKCQLSKLAIGNGQSASIQALRAFRLAPLALAALAVSGCHTDMWVQPKLTPEAPMDTTLFVDGASARPLVPGTIARGHLREDQPFYTGIENGHYMDRLPMPVTRELLDRGRERFDIYCSPCHGRLGNGQGMIAHRGLALRRPVGNYQTDRLRKMPVGYFYDVMTNGYGAMFSYASRVDPRDRWAIAAYIRALQLSEHAPTQVTGNGVPAVGPRGEAPIGAIAQPGAPGQPAPNADQPASNPIPNTMPTRPVDAGSGSQLPGRTSPGSTSGIRMPQNRRPGATTPPRAPAGGNNR